jgi:hypothetical protein
MSDILKVACDILAVCIALLIAYECGRHDESLQHKKPDEEVEF